MRAEVEIDLAPLVREELESKLMTTKTDRAMAREILKVVRSDSKVKVDEGVAQFILNMLKDSIRTISKDRWLSQEPALKYHLGALEHAVKTLNSQPIAATLSTLIADAQTRSRHERVSQEEVASLVAAAAFVIEAKGKCPETGCVVQRKGSWRVISNRTGKLWPQTYDTKKDADDALAAYHLRRKGVPPR